MTSSKQQEALEEMIMCHREEKNLTNFSIEAIIADRRSPFIASSPLIDEQQPNNRSPLGALCKVADLVSRSGPSSPHEPTDTNTTNNNNSSNGSNISNISNNNNNTIRAISISQSSSCRSNQSSASARRGRAKNFRCNTCKMSFANSGQLKNHERIHTGERPFRCDHDDCGKSFTRNEELTRHKLIHSGVRPHSCQKCYKKFGRKDHLKKHLLTHQQNKRSRYRAKMGGDFMKPTTAMQREQEEIPFANERIYSDNQSSYLNSAQMPTSFSLPAARFNLPAAGRLPPPPPTLDHSVRSVLIQRSTPAPLPSPFINVAPYVSLPPILPPLRSSFSSSPSNSSNDSLIQRAAHLGAQMAALNLQPEAQQRQQSQTAIQQLANDYWNWYSFIGLYQNNGQYSQTPPRH